MLFDEVMHPTTGFFTSVNTEYDITIVLHVVTYAYGGECDLWLSVAKRTVHHLHALIIIV